jgi:oxygen-independent coproporphyrinogen-3 oxidase
VTEAAGLYLHWPFCRVRCSYCTFFVSTEPAYRGDYLRALEREVALVGETAEGVSFDSIYLGGGTPSRLPPADLEQLLRRVRTHLAFLGDVEVTLEANPEDIEPDTVRAWTAAGVNRISLGVQSFAKAELEATGRQHDPAIGARALEIVSRSGAGVCADLILGLPEQTPGSFRDSLARLLEFSIEHVSIYLLEDSRETAVDRRHNPQRYLADDAQADLWLEACERLSEHGFSHYEISNWARPGRHARHNVKYWDRLETLGLGVSAHEFWRGRRRANVASLERYIAELEAGRRPNVFDWPISPEESERETVVLGLRKAEGVAAEAVHANVAQRGDERLEEDYRQWREGGWLQERDGRVAFTEKGFLVSNEILCRFV